MNQAALIDRANEVRHGEELPVEVIDPWLKKQISDLEGTPTVTQYSGGASNWTYCLTYNNRELILRRAPKGRKAKGAHDMAREFNLQNTLKSVFPLVPDMLALCQDDNVLDSDFYVMEKLSGVIPRRNFPKSLHITEETTRQLCKNMIDALIDLHNVDIQAQGLDNLAKGQGYVDRQIAGWSKRFEQAHTWNVPKGSRIIKWLEINKPQQETICLTHNDFRFDNLVLDASQPSKIIGVLDWELATLGDPLMDLGNALAYWVEAGDDFLAQSTRRQPTHLPGMMTREEVVTYYCQKRRIDQSDFKFYEVFGLFRLAGIAQQIYYRYHHKQTRNPAFKNFWIFVHYLLWRCKRAMA